MTKQPQLNVDELRHRLATEFPQMMGAESGLSIVDVWYGGCRLRQEFRARSLRPGDTISGPAIMALGDIAVYIALLASIGWVPLAVTTNLTINFLRKAGRNARVAECRLLKLGKRLAVGEVVISADDEGGPIAHVTATYSIPPQTQVI